MTETTPDWLDLAIANASVGLIVSAEVKSAFKAELSGRFHERRLPPTEMVECVKLLVAVDVRSSAPVDAV